MHLRTDYIDNNWPTILSYFKEIWKMYLIILIMYLLQRIKTPRQQMGQMIYESILSFSEQYIYIFMLDEYF